MNETLERAKESVGWMLAKQAGIPVQEASKCSLRLQLYVNDLFPKHVRSECPKGKE